MATSGIVFGSDANAKISAGVVGLGGRGKMIAGMVRDHGGFALTAVADYFPRTAGDAGDRFDVPESHHFSGLSGYRRLLDSGVEAVFLETPPYCFPEHAKAAVDAGCHVFMAKPVACDVPGCKTIADAGKKATSVNQVFLVDFQTRTDPLIIEGIRRMQDGEIGALTFLSSLYADESFADPPLTDTVESRLQSLVWVNDIALGGGYLVNAGIHAIDVALWMAGTVPSGACGGSAVARENPHGDSPDIYSLTYEFDNGLLLNHRGEHLRNRFGFRCDCTGYCRHGHLDTAYDGDVRMLGTRTGWAGGKVEGLYRRGAIANISTFHEQVLAGVYDNLTVTPSVNATLSTILGREAARRGEPMTWTRLLDENVRIEPDLSGLKD
jgi:predicted dehydrogenase